MTITNMPKGYRLMTVEKYAHETQMSRTQIQKLIAEGRLPGVQIETTSSVKRLAVVVKD